MEIILECTGYKKLALTFQNSGIMMFFSAVCSEGTYS